MEAIECLLTRRSVREFLDKEVNQEDLDIILKCASFAPSAMNNQSWHFSVVTNKEWLNKMSQIIAKFMNRETYHVTYHAPVLIIVSDKRDNLIYEHDGSCALENIFLSAHALGLGSVWINQLGEPGLYSNPEFLNLLKEAGVPDGYKVVGSAAIGYLKNIPEAKKRVQGNVTYLK